MIAHLFSKISPFALASAFFALGLVLPIQGAPLRTVERTLGNPVTGERPYTCLALEGGIVPLLLPEGVQLDLEEEVKLLWPQDRGVATFRSASAAEIALLAAMDQPDGPVLWKKYLASTLSDAADEYTVRDFQPNTLAVNGWRIGTMAMDYSFSGVKSCALLLLWRCRDGSTLAVTMRAGQAAFKARSEQIYSMIGAAMVLPE